MRQAIVEKSVDGKFPIGLKYFPPDLASGETIELTTTVSVSPAGLTLGAVAIADNEISAEVSGGVVKEEYKVQFWMITSTGKEFKHPVKDSIIVKVVS
jgi:hypothetical protein